MYTQTTGSIPSPHLFLITSFVCLATELVAVLCCYCALFSSIWPILKVLWYFYVGIYVFYHRLKKWNPGPHHEQKIARGRARTDDQRLLVWRLGHKATTFDYCLAQETLYSCACSSIVEHPNALLDFYFAISPFRIKGIKFREEEKLSECLDP